MTECAVQKEGISSRCGGSSEQCEGGFEDQGKACKQPRAMIMRKTDLKYHHALCSSCGSHLQAFLSRSNFGANLWPSTSTHNRTPRSDLR